MGVCKPLDVCLPNGLAHSLGSDHKFNLPDKTVKSQSTQKWIETKVGPQRKAK